VHAIAIGSEGGTEVHLEEMRTSAVVEKVRIAAATCQASIQLEPDSAMLVLGDRGFGVLAVINVARVGASVLVTCAEVTDFVLLRRLL
jgi:hypothetical protein